MNSKIIVDKVTASKRELLVDYHCTGDITNYIKGNRFTAEYDFNIEDIPESLLIIPFLANVCPISWVTNSIIYCKQVDLHFFKSLYEIRDSFQSLYPRITWSGDLKPDLIINNEEDYPVSTKSALFFTGGINSLASFIQRKNDKPLLISVYGAEIGETMVKDLQPMVKELSDFADARNTKVIVVKSNFRSIVDYKNISLAYGALIAGHWWTNVQNGLGMIGLSAPITYHYQISRLYYPAIHNPDPTFVIPFGSHPEIDNKITWGGNSFKVYHQGYVLTRHEKIALISDYIKKYDSNLKINVCSQSQDGHNCSSCEKCIRTIISMILEGLTPSNHGFDDVNEKTLEQIRNEIEHNGLVTPMYIHQYENIQKHVPYKKQDLPEFALDFFQWFEKVNLAKINRKKFHREIWNYYSTKIKKGIKESSIAVKVIQAFKKQHSGT